MPAQSMLTFHPLLLPLRSGGAFKLLWSDEFSYLNRAKWEPQIGNGCQFDIPGWGNNERRVRCLPRLHSWLAPFQRSP